MAHRHIAKPNPRIKRLRDIAKLTHGDMTRMTTTLDTRFRKNEKTLFATQGSSGGERWAALSAGYAKWKRKAKPGRKIMVFSGRTRKSLTQKGGQHVAAYVIKPKATIKLGTERVVAAYHIKGPLKNPNVPERDTLQMTLAQARGLTRLVWDYLVDVKLRRVERAMRAGAR